MPAWSNQINAMPPAEGSRHGHMHLLAWSFHVSSLSKLKAMFYLRRDVLEMRMYKGHKPSLQTYSAKKAKMVQRRFSALNKQKAIDLEQ